jgi:hypothetical protein
VATDGLQEIGPEVHAKVGGESEQMVVGCNGRYLEEN